MVPGPRGASEGTRELGIRDNSEENGGAAFGPAAAPRGSHFHSWPPRIPPPGENKKNTQTNKKHEGPPREAPLGAPCKAPSETPQWTKPTPGKSNP